MTNSNTTRDALLARLNELRVANGERALRANTKMSVADMNARIAEYAPASDARITSPFAIIAREFGVSPKIVRRYYRAHVAPSCRTFNANDKTQMEQLREIARGCASRSRRVA